jgi:hypothetical protein
MFRISQGAAAANSEKSLFAGFLATVCVGLQRFRHDGVFLERSSISLK